MIATTLDVFLRSNLIPDSVGQTITANLNIKLFDHYSIEDVIRLLGKPRDAVLVRRHNLPLLRISNVNLIGGFSSGAGNSNVGGAKRGHSDEYPFGWIDAQGGKPEWQGFWSGFAYLDRRWGLDETRSAPDIGFRVCIPEP